MQNKIVNCNGIEIANNKKITLIAGPCQLESEQHAMDMSGKIKEITSKLNIGFVYKIFLLVINVLYIKSFIGVDGIDKNIIIVCMRNLSIEILHYDGSLLIIIMNLFQNKIGFSFTYKIINSRVYGFFICYRRKI